MVVVEVARAVLIERDPWRTGVDRRSDVGAIGVALVVLGDAEWCEGRGKLRVCGGSVFISLRAEAPDAVGAEVAFAGDGVMRSVAVRLGIGLAAEAAGLLRAEPDDADGAQRVGRHP